LLCTPSRKEWLVWTSTNSRTTILIPRSGPRTTIIMVEEMFFARLWTFVLHLCPGWFQMITTSAVLRLWLQTSLLCLFATWLQQTQH
jgi:hypothetical protein